ncbi:hypothetical protein Tco_1212906 [Tanacetum coccineum]
MVEKGVYTHLLVSETCAALDGGKGSALTLSLTLRSLNLYPRILCHLAILCLHPHAHYPESLLTISCNIDLLLDLLAILSLMFFEDVLHLVVNLTCHGLDATTVGKTCMYRASQSGQHGSRKSPTAKLFDIDSGIISIITVNTKEYHYDVLAGVDCHLFNINDLEMRKPIEAC